MTLTANFIRSTWSKYWILSSSEWEICSTKTFAGGKFEDVLKCITSTDMIFRVTPLYAGKDQMSIVSMSNVNVRNAKSKMLGCNFVRKLILVVKHFHDKILKHISCTFA